MTLTELWVGYFVACILTSIILSKLRETDFFGYFIWSVFFTPILVAILGMLFDEKRTKHHVSPEERFAWVGEIGILIMYGVLYFLIWAIIIVGIPFLIKAL